MWYRPGFLETWPWRKLDLVASSESSRGSQRRESCAILAQVRHLRLGHHRKMAWRVTADSLFPNLIRSSNEHDRNMRGDDLRVDISVQVNAEYQGFGVDELEADRGFHDFMAHARNEGFVNRVQYGLLEDTANPGARFALEMLDDGEEGG